MGYSVKKAGVGFKAKVETSADFTGQAAGFSAFYIDDATGTKTDITGSFTEDANAAGLYFSPTVTIPTVGDYTIVINNSSAGMDNHPTPIVVTGATIDDVKTVVDDLATTLAVVAADVDGLNGQDLQDLKDQVSAVKTLIDDSSDIQLTFTGDETGVLSVGETATGDTSGATGTVQSVSYDAGSGETTVVVTGTTGTFTSGETVNDGTTSTTASVDTVVINSVNSVLEFVKQIDAALSGGGTGLSALEGYTDDIENMLLGTEFLADGTTSNPFYDATNPGVAKESSLYSVLSTLQGNISTAVSTLETDITNAKDAIIVKTDAIQAVVDANKLTLENAGYGLSALKDLIDGVATDVGTAETNILNVLNDASNGLANIRSEMNTRFDTVDAAIADIDTAIGNIAGAQSFNAFV